MRCLTSLNCFSKCGFLKQPTVQIGKMCKSFLALPVLAYFWRKSPVCTFSSISGRRKSGYLPLPYCSIPEPKGQDLHFVNVYHSYLIHTEWCKLKSLSSGLSSCRIRHILLKIKSDAVLSVEFFNWVKIHRPDVLTVEIHSMLIHILTKAKQFKVAESLLKEYLIPKTMDNPCSLFDVILYSYCLCDSSPRVFDCLFGTYAHMKKFRNATNIFCRMRDYGFVPTIESCNAYMCSLLDLHRTDILLAFYREMGRCRISPNVYTFNMVISAFCKLGKLEKAVEVFRKMENMACAPSVASYNTLIAGYCSNELLDQALKLKGQMANCGLQPNVVTFNTIINAFCKKGRIHEANRIFSEMKTVGLYPNTITYNTLINGYCIIEKSDMGLRLYDDMLKGGVQVDILTYNALILALCNDGKTKKASHLVKKLLKENLKPNAATFSALIRGHCKRQNSEQAFQLYMKMKHKGFYPLVETLHLMVLTFLRNKDFEGVIQIIFDMVERSIAPDVNILGAVFKSLHAFGRPELATKLWAELERRPLLPEGFNKDKLFAEY